ncbi:hypothetical protein NEISUBOT_04348 [Neisseria subflava NJ9703]|uniref:Uncharacterized protein n=1 Tax=Neisseria subflava NJ9703 TaxID=546268 RepID=A0A9W5IR80_NEISU|nr:hypothetical protein NEISUBOT_04348 [Neisseria subflava NJ9703]
MLNAAIDISCRIRPSEKDRSGRPRLIKRMEYAVQLLTCRFG